MLLIISDIHLGDGTTAESIPPSAFQLFANRVREMAYFASWRADGTYRPPSCYSGRALVTVNTHDLPTVAGFDPMMQFIHEEDLSEAIALALENDLRGVFNVVGPGAVPLKQAIRAVGKPRISVPEPFARLLFQQLFRLNMYEFPPSALEYLKYPCTIAGERFERATGFEPLFSLQDIFASVAK